MAAPVAFKGTLTQNAVLNTLYNMIIGQEVFSKNIAVKGTLADKFRIDGTLYGDTKLFISTDIGTIYDFPNSGKTLLSKTQPVDPEVQAVKVDTFKQTALTVDGVKLKQAFMSADIYGAFVSVVLQWLRDSMKILNMTLINSFIGTVVTEADVSEVEVDIYENSDATSISELRQAESYAAERIGAKLADVMIDLKDVLRDFNEYNFLRSYDVSDFMIVWNKAWNTKIRHISLPQIFNKDDVLGKYLDTEVLNDRYFGNIKTTGGTVGASEEVRTLVDRVIDGLQYFPGDLLPSGATYLKGQAYANDNTIICKIVHKRAIPFMSALIIQTEFYNPKDLDRNHYLTWGYSQPTYLKELPIITVKANMIDLKA